MAVIHKYQHFPMLRKSTLLDTLPQSLSSKSIKENVSISLEFLLLKVYNISAQYTQRLQKTTSWSPYCEVEWDEILPTENKHN